MKKIIILSFFSICALNLPAQSFFKNTRLSVGFAAQAQDRRYSNLDNPQTITPQNGSSRIDFEYNFLINKPIYTFRRLETSVGLGYSLWRSTFPRPFDQSYFGTFNRGFRLTDAYNIHKIVLPLTGRLYIGQKRNINLQISALPTLSINRYITQTDRNFSSWEFSPYSIEINPGIGFKAGKNSEVNLNYRAYQLAALDRVIFENENRKTDTYNPFKLWLSVGYVF